MKLQHRQAQDFIMTWYKSELTYIRDFRVWKNKSKLDWGYQNGFTEALYYFEVTCWDDPELVRSLMNHTFDFVNPHARGSVDAFALKLAGLFDDNPTSLASKILFLSNAQKITPTSASVRAAVGLRADTYSLYRDRFTEFRDKNLEEIVENLRTIAPILSRIEEQFAEIPKLQKVRINRNTDQLLRLKGRQKLDLSSVSTRRASDRSQGETTSDYIKPATIDALRAIEPERYDATALVRLCEELNICYADGRVPEVEMIVRSIQEHVRPIFKVAKFWEILSDYHEGSPEFRRSIITLMQSQRDIANYWLHGKRRPNETPLTMSKVEFTREVNILLDEAVKILRR